MISYQSMLFLLKGEFKMTQLKCSVRNCMHNDKQLCAKGDITIGGSSADAPNETRCESFQQKTTSASNSLGHPSKNIEVDCEAANCIFNKECKCNAEEIGIAGSNACSCAETECGSFTCSC